MSDKFVVPPASQMRNAFQKMQADYEEEFEKEHDAYMRRVHASLMAALQKIAHTIPPEGGKLVIFVRAQFDQNDHFQKHKNKIVEDFKAAGYSVRAVSRSYDSTRNHDSIVLRPDGFEFAVDVADC